MASSSLRRRVLEQSHKIPFSPTSAGAPRHRRCTTTSSSSLAQVPTGRITLFQGSRLAQRGPRSP